MEPTRVEPLMGRHSALLVLSLNIRLGWKCQTEVTNVLA